MTSLLRWSSLTYRRLLILYPQDLRREFATEMALVFAEDVADAWREEGAVGVMKVWWYALAEFMRIGVPGQWANPYVAVPVIAFVLNVAMLGTEAGVASRHVPATVLQGPLIGDAIARIVLLPSLAHAAVAFAVVRLSRSTPPISLLLACTGGEAGTEGGDDHA